jgi:hypothetical protein
MTERQIDKIKFLYENVYDPSIVNGDISNKLENLINI